MNPSRILISAALVLAALVVLAACTTTKTIIVQATPNTGVKAAHHAVHQASAVACGLITCSHGKVGQACTVAGYPGIIVQSSPTQLACDPKPGNFPSATAAPPLPGQPSPVSTTANLSSSCAMGWEWTPNDTNAADGMFRSGFIPNHWDSSSGDPALAYQVTLTNNDVSTAQVTGFAVVFYDTNGTEAGSDQEQVSGFITPAQSLAWTVIEDHTVSGYGDDPNGTLAQTGAIPGNAATCQLVQWYTRQ